MHDPFLQYIKIKITALGGDNADLLANPSRIADEMEQLVNIIEQEPIVTNFTQGEIK